MPTAPAAVPTGAGPSAFSRQRWRAAAVPVVALAAAAAAVVVLDPVHHDVPLCPFHALTGLWCPFCGGLRAVWLLAHLQVGAALASNLVLFAAAPYFAWRWWRIVSARPPSMLRLGGRTVPPAAVTLTVIALLVGYTVLRNLPAGSFLAPAS